MSTALTQLTGDVASFYNISQDLAYIKLKSVFTGETETLKDLGVVMTQSALDQYALANGYGKTTSAIGNIASGFADAWNKNNVGTQIIQNIANALVVVMQFIERIAADTATWAANLDFYPLLESISNLTSAFTSFRAMQMCY